jgi:hypothetical protein
MPGRERKRERFEKESDLAAVVVRWLQDADWDVYQEVQVFAFSQRADIVARRGAVLWVIESKLRFSFEVIDQAERWRWLANRVSVAVPESAGNRVSAQRVLKLLGVGLLLVPVPEGEAGRSRSFTQESVREAVPPTFVRREGERLRQALCEEHKTFAAAGSQGGYYTPFNATRGALSKWILSGKIPGVRVEWINRKMKLFPSDNAPVEG